MIDWDKRIASTARRVEALRSRRMRTFILPGYQMETTSVSLAQAEATLAAYIRARDKDHCVGSAM